MSNWKNRSDPYRKRNERRIGSPRKTRTAELVVPARFRQNAAKSQTKNTKSPTKRTWSHMKGTESPTTKRTESATTKRTESATTKRAESTTTKRAESTTTKRAESPKTKRTESPTKHVWSKADFAYAPISCTGKPFNKNGTSQLQGFKDKEFHSTNLETTSSEDFNVDYIKILNQTRNLGQEGTAIIDRDLVHFTHLHNTMFLFGVPTPHVNMTLTMIQFYVSKLFRANGFQFMTFLVETDVGTGRRRRRNLCATMSESTSDNLCLIHFPYEDRSVANGSKKTSKFLFYCLLLLFSSSTLTFDNMEIAKMLKDLHPASGVDGSNLRGRVDIYAYAQLELIQMISTYHNRRSEQIPGKEWDKIEAHIISEYAKSKLYHFDTDHSPKLRSLIKTARYIYSALLIESEGNLSDFAVDSSIDVKYVFSYDYMATNDNFDIPEYRSDGNEFVYAPFKRENITCNNGNRCSESKMFSYFQDRYFQDTRNMSENRVSDLLRGGVAYWFGPSERDGKYGTIAKFCLKMEDMIKLGYVEFFEQYRQTNERDAVEMLESIHKETKLEQTTFEPKDHIFVSTHDPILQLSPVDNYLKVAIRYALPCPGCQKNYCSYVNNTRVATKGHIEACQFENCGAPKKG